MATTVRKIVKTDAAAKPRGAYNQAVVVDKTMYISALVGMEPDSGEMVSGVEGQTERCLKNMKAILQSAGADMGNVVKTTIYLGDISDWPKVNTVYETFFTSNFPARAAFGVQLPKDILVAIEATAVVGSIQDIN